MRTPIATLPMASPKQRALESLPGYQKQTAIEERVPASVLNPQGLGNGMIIAAQSLQPALVWAELLWVGLAG